MLSNNLAVTRFQPALWLCLLIIGLMVTFTSCANKDQQLAESLRKTAEQGDAVSQYNLALLYYNGKGVPKDLTLAIQWMTKSAEQKYGEAQLNLSIMYDGGEGVPPDRAIGYQWMLLAAAHLMHDAPFMLDRLHQELSLEQRTKGIQLAQDWLTKHGSTPAQEWLANYLIAQKNKPTASSTASQPSMVAPASIVTPSNIVFPSSVDAPSTIVTPSESETKTETKPIIVVPPSTK